jgi:hypothetical protein
MTTPRVLSVEQIVRECADPDAPVRIEAPRQHLASRALRAALRNAGWYAATLDRAPVISKETLLHALYQSGEYPGSFGFNWDALADALTDYSWLDHSRATPYAGIALIWRNPAVLEQRAPEVYDTFLELLDEAAEKRAAAGVAALRVLAPDQSVNP